MKSVFIEKLDIIFSKLRIKEFSEAELESQFTTEEKRQLNQNIEHFELIKKIVKDSMFKNSLYLEWAILFNHFAVSSGLSNENIGNFNPPEYNMFKLIVDYPKNLDSIVSKSEFNIETNENVKNFDLELIKALNIIFIQSILFDYNFARFISGLFNEVNEEVKFALLDLKLEMKNMLENSASFWDETDIGKYKYKRAILNNGTKNPKNLFLTEGMIEAIICSVNNVKKINEDILENTLTPGLISEIIELIEFSETYDFINETLVRLNDVFLENCSFSDRKKKLIVHQLLLFFNHPEAMTSIDEEVFLRKENSTLATLEQAKIRIVERIIKS